MTFVFIPGRQQLRTTCIFLCNEPRYHEEAKHRLPPTNAFGVPANVHLFPEDI